MKNVALLMEDGAFALALFSSLPRRIWQLNVLQPPKNANTWGSAPGEEGELGAAGIDWCIGRFFMECKV